jgi:hypothetical protein
VDEREEADSKVLLSKWSRLQGMEVHERLVTSNIADKKTQHLKIALLGRKSLAIFRV